MTTHHQCRICDSTNIEVAFDFGRQPVIHHLLTNPNDQVDLHDFKVNVCKSCGFLQISDFLPPEKLYSKYFTVSSWKNQPHVNRLLELIETIFTPDKKANIFEIGCNDGGFLTRLKERGYSRVAGIEPSSDAFQIASVQKLNVVNDFYSKRYVIDCDLENTADFIITRQVIEHIPDLHDFLEAIHNHLTADGGLILEFPDTSMNFEQLDYTFWEEHVNYFTIDSIRRILKIHGFYIVHHESVLFSGKAMWVLAKKLKFKQKGCADNSADIITVGHFIEAFPTFKLQLRNFLERSTEEGIIVYGAGARSCNFVNFLGIGELVSYFVDDQAEKQNLYVPGYKLPIQAFKEADTQSFILLGVNCENENKLIFKRFLTNFCSILPPSRLLPDFWLSLANKILSD